jgi:hypothetical protein
MHDATENVLKLRHYAISARRPLCIDALGDLHVQGKQSLIKVASSSSIIYPD